MATAYERCGECGCEYESEFVRRIGERRICSMCRWLSAGISKRRVIRKTPESGASPRAVVRS
jgi:hypothetical protein